MIVGTFLFMTTINVVSAATNSDYVIMVTKESADTTIENGEEKWRHRMPPRRIVCTISENDGVVIGIDKEDITAYEVWTAEGDACLATWTDEATFVEYVFSVTRDCIIRFVTEEYVYTGYLIIE